MTSPFSPSRTNEETYEELISLIENSQGRLAPIIVACDDWALRQRVIDRYETEAQQANILPYRVEMGREPSVRAALAKLKETDAALQQGRPAVFTITGADTLLRVTLKPEDEQSELDKFFGYLQWTREGLREFRYPIVLWVSHRILKEISRRAPDFWSWRKAVLRFEAKTNATVNAGIIVSGDTLNADQVVVGRASSPHEIQQNEPRDDFLPPLEELQAEIQQLESTSPDSPNLATLYNQLGRVYADRVTTGKAADLDQEQQAAIASFQTAINHYQQLSRKLAQATALSQLGNFLYSQSRFRDAIDLHQQALAIAREIGDRQGEAASLGNLGSAYRSLGQYPQAINLHQQALAIARETGDRRGEAASLGNLGNAYDSLGQYPQAIDFHQQALAIKREIGDRQGEAISLGSLGNAYDSLGQYPQAIDFHQQALAIQREIGDRRGEAASLGNLGSAYNSLGQYSQAIDFHQQHLSIAREIGDRQGEANALGNLGSAYRSLGQYPQGIDFHQQHLSIACEIGDRQGEANALGNLGNAYYSLGQYPQAIDFYQQHLSITREIGDRQGEANALGNLGSAYNSLGQYPQAIDFYQQSLAIQREIGDRHGEADTLFNLALALAKLDQHWEGLQRLNQAKQLYTALKLDHRVEECDAAIYDFNRIIAAKPRSFPKIRDEPPLKLQRTRKRVPWWVYFLMGLAIALLIAWLL